MLLFGSFTRKRRFHNLLFKKGVRSEFILATMWDWHEIWRMHIRVVHLNICAVFTSFPCLRIYFYVIQWLKFMFWLFTYQLKWRNVQDNSTCYRWSFKVLSVHHNNISGTILHTASWSPSLATRWQRSRYSVSFVGQQFVFYWPYILLLQGDAFNWIEKQVQEGVINRES
jgi:hypothetical protein